jgi:ATP-binding protein involved in chromosome partitioning
MSVTKETIADVLRDIALPQGGTLGAADLVRALTLNGDAVQFVIEAADPAMARRLEPVRAEAQRRVAELPGVAKVTVALTAHGPAPARAAPARPAPGPQDGPPSLKIGRHPTETKGRQAVPGVDRILAIGSGKGGVGKSTVSSNLAVALAREGRRVGLLDADFYGPSQTRMMGVSKRPASPDGKTIIPLHAHGVTVMSIGLMVDPDQAVVWRGPMLMGALQQMLGQVQWGELDVLLIDMPPGTGDVQLTLCQKYQLGGAVIVSTPQDVALMDARRALEMFQRLKTPVAGLIENMSTHICPQCGYEDHIFGHGGVASEAERHGLPYLGALPLNIDVRLAADSGTPITAGDSALADPYRAVARKLVADGFA